jgi:hypothetical protein
VLAVLCVTLLMVAPDNTVPNVITSAAASR